MWISGRSTTGASCPAAPTLQLGLCPAGRCSQQNPKLLHTRSCQGVATQRSASLSSGEPVSPRGRPGCSFSCMLTLDRVAEAGAPLQPGIWLQRTPGAAQSSQGARTMVLAPWVEAIVPLALITSFVAAMGGLQVRRGAGSAVRGA